MVKRKRETEESAMLDPSSRSFVYDEVDDFNDGSDDEIYGSIKIIKEKKTKEHVLGIGGDTSDDDDDDDDEADDNESDDNEHDEVDNEESDGDSEEESDHNSDLLDNDIQSSDESESGEDERAMGKNKKHYFGTDLTDERIHKAAKRKNKKKEEEALEIEIKGAKQLQERVRKEITEEEDFSQLLLLPKEPSSAPDQEEDVPEFTTSSASKPMSTKKMKKSMAEILPMVNDLNEKIEELKNTLSPLIEAKKKGLLEESNATQYLQTRYLLCLNYVNIVSGYMMIKYSGADMAEHPVTSRVAQYKHLFTEMEICEQKYEGKLETMLSDLKSGKLKKVEQKKERKMLSVIKEKKKKKKRKGKSAKKNFKETLDQMEDKMGEENMSDEDSCAEEDIVQAEGGAKVEGVVVSQEDRRMITHQMVKNKGLMPSRKKEQRNPRVKYKMKYQNKLKRRKGQVRTVRKELTRYGGEISGIKTNVVKSIKMK